MDAVTPELFDAETGELLLPPSAIKTEKFGPAGNALETALFGMYKELPVSIGKDAEATITGSQKRKYSSLKAIMAVVKPIAINHGIRIRQGADHAWQLDTNGTKGRAVPVYTDFIHSATGQGERTTVEVPLSKLDAQGMGSAVSYGRRYSILAALGLTSGEDDDDGVATVSRKITDTPIEESQELWAIKAEMRECTTLRELTDWGRKAEETGRIERLSESERPAAYLFNSERVRALRYAHETEIKKEVKKDK
jgi:hypothetical protein